jgi:hypothetical protein
MPATTRTHACGMPRAVRAVPSQEPDCPLVAAHVHVFVGKISRSGENSRGAWRRLDSALLTTQALRPMRNDAQGSELRRTLIVPGPRRLALGMRMTAESVRRGGALCQPVV